MTALSPRPRLWPSVGRVVLIVAAVELMGLVLVMAGLLAGAGAAPTMAKGTL